MGIDLYAGPLCRYYARDFVTPAMALFPPERRNVLDPKTGKVQRHKPENPAKYRNAILGWMLEIKPRLRRAGPMVVRWQELPRSEYFCDQYRTWHELRYFAAYAQVKELEMPRQYFHSQSPDAAFEIAREMGYESEFASIIHCKLWLPLEHRHPIEIVLPTQERSPVGSVAGLRAEAEDLARRFLGESTVTLDTLQAVNADESRTPLERAAADGIFRILRVTDFALTHKQPVVVDY
ncbi:MAG: hypothetical protein ACIAQ0_07900 [Phycisphaerales bacterium JB058]